MLGSGNPALNENTFHLDEAYYTGKSDAMTVQGTVHKTMLLLAICVGTGTFTWGMAMSDPAKAMPWMLGGLFGGLVLALITIFKQAWSPYTSPLYAAAQGLFLGAVSAWYEQRFGSGGLSGIVAQAVGLTLGVTAAMLILYTFRIITVTAKLRAGILMATGGVVLFYVVSIVLSLVGVDMGAVHGATPLSIGISLVIVAIAAFNLLVDFDFIERGARAGAPKHMEWYGAFGLMVTLVWLYLELLRLLSKLQSRD